MAEGNIREAVSPPRGYLVRSFRAVLYRLRRKFPKRSIEIANPLTQAEEERVRQEMAAETKLHEKYQKQLEERARKQQVEEQREWAKQRMIEVSDKQRATEKKNLLKREQQLQEKYRLQGKLIHR